ncbi:response regulator [Rhodoblastus sphagnicola]|nr:response regulator [Rhodoblastus sphagnicola]
MFEEERPLVHVLIVDDDAEDVFLLRRLLRRSKRVAYQVADCREMDEGAALAAAGDVDLVFLDFVLGLGLSLGGGRANHDLLALPFILLSGLDIPDLKRIARDAGALDYLCKSDLTVEALDELALKVSHASAQSPEAGAVSQLARRRGSAR